MNVKDSGVGPRVEDFGYGRVSGSLGLMLQLPEIEDLVLLFRAHDS